MGKFDVPPQEKISSENSEKSKDDSLEELSVEGKKAYIGYLETKLSLGGMLSEDEMVLLREHLEPFEETRDKAVQALKENDISPEMTEEFLELMEQMKEGALMWMFSDDGKHGKSAFVCDYQEGGWKKIHLKKMGNGKFRVEQVDGDSSPSKFALDDSASKVTKKRPPNLDDIEDKRVPERGKGGREETDEYQFGTYPTDQEKMNQ